MKPDDEVATILHDRAIRFAEKLKGDHDRVNPCFMTGRGCVYRTEIDKARSDRNKLAEQNNKRLLTGFMVMPFRPHTRVFFTNTFKPCVEQNYSAEGLQEVKLSTGEEVPRPGIVICEGICKRIQEADFVMADLSLPNDNVFFELGLAHGLNHRVVLTCQSSTRAKNQDSQVAKEDPYAGWRAWIFQHFTSLKAPIYVYRDLEPIDADMLKLEDKIWTRHLGTEPPLKTTDLTNHRILVIEHPDDAASVDLNESDVNSSGYTSENATRSKNNALDDIRLSEVEIIKSYAGVAMTELLADLSTAKDSQIIDLYKHAFIEPLKSILQVDTVDDFTKVRDAIDSAFCIIVRTGKGCHPMSYFWLGYAYSRGKNVIPITICETDKDNLDLAFDIRAQRHITLYPDKPDKIFDPLKASLRHMIESDFTHRSRRALWDSLLGPRGNVSIFTGALHVNQHAREMIGDWDLRTASELSSYFGRREYEVRIETPVYSFEWATKRGTLTNDYPILARELLKDKNCILIASADVNPLTEIVLGEVFGVPSEALFDDSSDYSKYHHAVIAKKQKNEAGDEKIPRMFFREETVEGGSAEEMRRGFMSGRFGAKPFAVTSLPFKSQQDQVQQWRVLAHLLFAPNPFYTEPHRRHFIVVMNGVSGPATYALAHVLTGGVSHEFSAYPKELNPQFMSEKALMGIVGDIRKMIDRWCREKSSSFVDCFIEVTVAGDGTDTPVHKQIIDWRRVVDWNVTSLIPDKTYDYNELVQKA